jgi:hypothetical protein
MNRGMPAPESLTKILPRERIAYFAEADELIIQDISCGILFVMAWWSGPARLAYKRLAEILARVDPLAKLQFVVVDTDGCPALYDKAEFLGRMSGAGETAWIKDGRIITTSMGTDPDQFETITKSLLT